MEAVGGAAPYAQRLGERLRNVRQQQGLSLHDVESASHGRMKASVVGAYERGERAVSVSRLRSLAEFYRVPVTQLLPDAVSRPRPRGAGAGLRIDLVRLDVLARPDAAPGVPEYAIIGRYLRAIQARRGDYNGRVLTMRGADVLALAAVLDTAPEELELRLVDAGVASSVGA